MYKANSASVLCDEELSQIESRMTKAFFIPYIEKPAQRQLVVQRVQDIISKDNPALAKIIHLGHCGWENVGHVQSPTYFAMFLCRKYNLLPSERCVLLSFNDQYHAIQLRLAKINKEKNGDFSAAASDVLDVWNQLCRDSVSYNKTFSKLSHSPYNDDGCDDLKLPSSQQQSYDPVEREMQSVVSSYQEFMENSACIDHFTAYALLRECMNSSREMINELTSRIYIIEGASHMPAMEREILKLFLSRAKVIEVSVSCPVSTSFSSDLNMSGINEEPLNLSHLAEAVNDQNHIDKESQIAAVSTSENEEVNSSQSEQTHCYPSRGEEISVKIDQLDSTSASYLADLSEMLCTSELSESELYIEQLIISYLRLLINTRDELALAVLCSMPGREISQQGFHDIKAEAQKKNMPMFQTIFSFIMRLRLGGKGYQADPNCPLLLHSKALGEFVDSVMKLQNIVEEEPCALKGALRVLTLIKSGLMRLRGRAIKGACIEKVWDSLSEAFMRLVRDSAVNGTPKKLELDPSLKLQQTTGALRPCLKHLVKLCDESSGQIPEEIVNVLGDNYLSQCNSLKKTATPVRIPNVLSLFRSPVEGCSSLNADELDKDAESSLRMRLMKNKGLTPKNKTTRFQSSCSWAPDDLSPIQKVERKLNETLSPIVGPTLNAVGKTSKSTANWKEIVESIAREEELRSKDISPVKNSRREVKKKEKRSKRSLLSDISNITSEPLKKPKTAIVTKKSPMKNKGKNLPVPKGQKFITAFFKV